MKYKTKLFIISLAPILIIIFGVYILVLNLQKNENDKNADEIEE